MKKLLALVLALVMSMSLVTISNAAFKDADKIDHTEAVEVMNALGVINGMPDGSFNPSGNVTRAEMAKMISIIMLGNVDADAFKGTTTDLKDINTHWAEGFIKYCYSQGVIAGKGDGTFAPNANVTTVEAAKMLLVAIGYNADVQGYVGADWQINIIRDAQISKFFDDLKGLSSNKVLTRDEAAQMIYNAVNAKTITKNTSVNRVTGETTDIYEANGDDLLLKTFDCNRTTLTYNGDDKINSSLKEGEILVGSTTITYTMKNDNAWIGEKVEVLWKDNTTKGTKNVLDKNDTIYGVYNNGETEVVIATSNDIKSATDYTTAGKIKVNGTEYKVATPAANDTLVIKNYGAESAVTAHGANADALTASAKAAFEGLSAQKGDTVKFILNDDGKVVKAYVISSKLGTVTAVSSDKITISGLGSIKIADNEVYSGAKKDDVVVYTKLYKSATADAYVVVKAAESVSGKVTGFKGTEKVTLDGTTYKIMNKASMPASVGGETGTTTFATNDIDETFTLYLVNGYVAAAVQTSESASNYSLVIDKNSGTAGSTFNELKIQVLASDGTKTTLVVNDKGAKNPQVGDIITYTGSASDAKVTVKSAKTTASSNRATTGYNKTSKTFNGIATTADAVLFKCTNAAWSAIDNTDNTKTFKTYSLRSMKSFGVTPRAYNYVTNDDGKVVAVFIGNGDSTATDTSNMVIGIVSDDYGQVKIGDDFFNKYSVVNNKETYTVQIQDGADYDTLTKGNVVAFAPSSDNQYDDNTGFIVLSAKNVYTDTKKTIDGTTYTVSTVYVKEYNESDKTLSYYTGKGTADGDKAYTAPTGLKTAGVDDDVVIYYVNADDDKAGDEIGVNEFNAQTGYANAIILVNSDSAVEYIVVETSDEANIFA
jgi:ribosomal 50S subunit-recycling heat shock protein